MYQKVLERPELVQRSLSIGVVACSVQGYPGSCNRFGDQTREIREENAMMLIDCASDGRIY